MNKVSSVGLYVLFLMFFTSCSETEESKLLTESIQLKDIVSHKNLKKTEINVSHNKANTFVEDDIEKSKVIGKLIFQINNKNFFKTDSILEFFKDNEQYKTGFFVPLSFEVDEKNIYIPNRVKHSILSYSRKGEFIKEFVLPKQYSPDYFSLLSDKSVVVNTFNLDTIVQIKDINIVYKTKSSDLRFSSFNENFLYIHKSSFFDKNGDFNGEFKFPFIHTIFDFIIFNNQSFCLIYYDEGLKKIVIETVNNKGVIVEKIKLDVELEWGDFNGIKILDVANTEVIFLLTGYIEDYKEVSLVRYDSQKKDTKTTFLTIDFEGDVFIGEGAALWSNGVIYKYNKSENSIYSLFTCRESINLCRFSLDW